MFEVPDLEILERKLGGERRREPSHVLDGGRILIDTETGEATPEQVDEVAPVSAAGIEHPPTVIEAALDDLVEEVDVDLSKPRPDLGTGTRQ